MSGSRAEWRLFTNRDILVEEHEDRTARPSVQALLDGIALHRYRAKLPRNHQRRAYRLTLAGAVLCLVEVRYAKRQRRLDVTAFRISTATERHVQLSLARSALAFLLCEAWRCGGSCALRFVVAEGVMPVPGVLQAVARSMSVNLSAPSTGVVTREEGRDLAHALVGLPDEGSARAQSIHAEGRCAIERLAFLYQSGVWGLAGLQAIIASPYPELVLRAGLSGHSQTLDALAIEVGCRARLLDVFATGLGGGLKIDDEGRVAHEATPSVAYERSNDVVVSDAPARDAEVRRWGIGEIPLPALGTFVLRARAHQSHSIAEEFVADIEEARSAGKTLGVAHAAVLWSSDFESLGALQRETILGLANSRGVAVLCARVPRSRLLEEAELRIIRAGRIRA